jgi:hypothetical protein
MKKISRPGSRSCVDHQADIAKVQEWLGHTNMGTFKQKTKLFHRISLKTTGGVALGYFMTSNFRPVKQALFWEVPTIATHKENDHTEHIQKTNA